VLSFVRRGLAARDDRSIEHREVPMLPSSPALVLVTLSFVAGFAVAQTVQAPVPQPTSGPAYRSAMEGYQPFADEKLAPWRDTNDNVGRIGGWRVYAKEAHAGASATPAAPAASAAGPHSGHGKH